MIYGILALIHHYLLLSDHLHLSDLLPSKLSYLSATSLAHFYNISHHLCMSWPWTISLAPIIVERRCRIQLKVRQWEFQEETRCHSETIEVPLMGHCI